MKKNKNLKPDFIKDYYKKVMDLTIKLEPILDEGWSQEEVFSLLLFMEKNKELVKGKEIQEIKKIYLSKKMIKGDIKLWRI